MCAVKHLERLTLICSFDFSIVFQFLHYLNISKMGFIFIIKKKNTRLTLPLWKINKVPGSHFTHLYANYIHTLTQNIFNPRIKKMKNKQNKTLKWTSHLGGEGGQQLSRTGTHRSASRMLCFLGLLAKIGLHHSGWRNQLFWDQLDSKQYAPY